jgi:anti-anti-sigma factor
MQIEQQRQGAVTVMKPGGPLAGEDAAQFRREAIEVMRESLGRFVIDVSQVAFCDSAGIEALLDVADEMAVTGRSLHLCGATETLREVLELLEVGQLFEHDQDVNTAVRSFL